MNLSLMRLWCILGLLAIIFTFGSSTGRTEMYSARKTRRLLVVTVTKGYRHSSIPTAERVLQQLSEQSHSYAVDYARTDEELVAKMSPQALKSYDAVVFANTTGQPTAKQTGNPKDDDPPVPDREAFMNWIKDGHAFVGVHSATDTFHNYPPYLEMIGAEFKTHGPQSSVECLVEDVNHPATKDLGKSVTVYDEIYQFQRFNRAGVHMLLALNKHPNTGEPGYYPLSWCRMYGKGRVFYTALGHREDVWESGWFQRHLLGGIQWALGQAKGSASPQIK